MKNSKKKTNGLLNVISVLALLILLTNSVISQTVLEGDYLISLIGKNKSYPEIKTILKNKDYKFTDKNKTGIYTSIDMGISLQFDDEGTLVVITLAHEHYSMQRFYGKLPGGYKFSNILNAKEFEWRKSTIGTPMLSHYKDVELKMVFKSEGVISELQISMLEDSPFIRKEGEGVPDNTIREYPSIKYQGDYFCEILGKKVTDTDVQEFLNSQELNIRVEEYINNNKEYVSSDYGFRIYTNNGIIYKVVLYNNYYKTELYKGLLPGDLSFDEIFESEKITWINTEEKYQTIYNDCRLELVMAKNSNELQSLVIDKDDNNLKRFFEGDISLPDGDNWIDLFFCTTYDRKFINIIGNTKNGFEYDKYNNSYVSKKKGVRIYIGGNYQIGSIYLFNNYENTEPYTGKLPGGCSFTDILSSGKISFKKNGNNYEAIFDNYKIVIWGPDDKTIGYCSIERYDKNAITNIEDGTLSTTNYDNEVDTYTSTSYSDDISIDYASQQYIDGFIKKGSTFVKKHSIRQVGGGEYYTTRVDFSMYTGSIYAIIVIYTKEGVRKLETELNGNDVEKLDLTPDLNQSTDDFLIKSFFTKTTMDFNATFEATIYFSDDYTNIDRKYKDMDILILRKKE